MMSVRMLAMGLAFSGLLVVLTVGGCQAPQSAGDLVSTNQLQDASYYKYWHVQVPLDEGDAAEDCYLVDDNLYVTTVEGNVFALHADHGLLRWSTKLTERDFDIYRPTHLEMQDGSDPVAFVTTTEVQIIDRFSGESVLSSPMPVAPGSAVVGDDQRIFIGSADGHVYSYYWRHRLGEKLLPAWVLTAGSPVTVAPVLRDDGELFFATMDGVLARCRAGDKAYGWTFRIGGAIVGDIVVDGGLVFAASLDRSLYCVDAESGALVWRRRFPRPLEQGPVVSRMTCYQFCPGEGLIALNPQTGEDRWTRMDGVRYVAASSGEVVIQTDAGTIEVLDADSGETLRSFCGGEMQTAARNLEDDRVFLLAADGRLECVRPEGVPYLRRQQVAASRANLKRKPSERAKIEPPPPPLPQPEETNPLRSKRDR
jgi:outer membrane protein assembly factor BamB